MHPGKSTASDTTARRRCALTAAITVPATIVGAIGCMAHVSARWLRMSGQDEYEAYVCGGKDSAADTFMATFWMR